MKKNPLKKGIVITLILLFFIFFIYSLELLQNCNTIQIWHSFSERQISDDKTLSISSNEDPLITDYRKRMAGKLYVNYEDTIGIGKTVKNNGITMTVMSSYTSGYIGIVLLSFTKDNGEDFYNSLNTGPINAFIKDNCKKDLNLYVISELSMDHKILYGYIAFVNSYGLSNETIVFDIENLECNQSQVEGVTFRDLIIYGKWSSDITLSENYDTLSATNTEILNTVSMCGKELQLNRVSLANVAVIFHTTVLKEEGLPTGMDAMLSSVSTRSGSYYGVYVKLQFKDGTSIDADCSLDEEGNIIAWFFQPIDMSLVKSATVGDVTIEMN